MVKCEEEEDTRPEVDAKRFYAHDKRRPHVPSAVKAGVQYESLSIEGHRLYESTQSTHV